MIDENNITDSENTEFDTKNNGYSIAALVLGIVGVLMSCAYGLGIIPSVLAIIFGKLSLDHRQGIEGLAKAGFILGIIGAAISAVIFILYILFIVFALASIPLYK